MPPYKKYAKRIGKSNAKTKRSFKKNMPGYSFKGAARSLLRTAATPQSYAQALQQRQVGKRGYESFKDDINNEINSLTDELKHVSIHSPVQMRLLLCQTGGRDTQSQ